MRNDHAVLDLARRLSLTLMVLGMPCVNAQQALAPWPDVPTVQDWLTEELRETRHGIRGAKEGREKGPGHTPSRPRPPAVELVAVYGTSRAWAVDVRIGGKIHVLRSTGADHADDAHGQDSIVADRREGMCLRLRYRATARRLCVPESGGQGSAS